MKYELIRQLNQSVPPLRALRDLGVRILKDSKHAFPLFVKHPNVNDEIIYIIGDEIFAPNNLTPLLGGDVIDLVACFKGSAEKSIDWLIGTYRHILNSLTGYEEEFLKGSLLATHQKKEKIHSWIWRNANALGHNEGSTVHDWLHERMRGGVNKNWMFPVSKIVYEEFILNNEKHPLPDIPNWMICVPYWASWGKLAGLEFRSQKGDWLHWFPVTASKISFAGLHAILPQFGAIKRTDIHCSFDACLDWWAYNHDMCGDVQNVCVRVNSSAQRLPPPSLSNPAFKVTSNVSVETAIQLFEAYPDLKVDTSNSKTNFLSWYLNVLEQEIKSNTEAIPLLLSYPINLESFVEQLLALNPSEKLKETLKKTVAGAPVHVSGGVITPSDTGYTWTKEGHDPILLTNFTLHLKESILLPDHRIILDGVLKLKDAFIPFQIERGNASSVTEFENSMVRAYNLYGGNVSRVPVVLAPKEGKFLQHVINSAISGTRFQRGFSGLGWVNETTFRSPFWEWTDRGWKQEKTSWVWVDMEQPHLWGEQPVAPFFNKFKFKPDSTMQALFVWLAEALLAGARGEKTSSFALEDSPRSRNVCRALMSIFGQKSFIGLSPNVRKNTESHLFCGLHAYPVFIRGRSAEFKYPCVVLNEGKDFSMSFSQSDAMPLQAIFLESIKKLFEAIWFIGPDTSSTTGWDVLEVAKNVSGNFWFFEKLVNYGAPGKWKRVRKLFETGKASYDLGKGAWKVPTGVWKNNLKNSIICEDENWVWLNAEDWELHVGDLTTPTTKAKKKAKQKNNASLVQKTHICG